jgi:hypothetical protein
VNVDHGLVAKIFEEEVNNLLKGKEERQPLKKRSNSLSNFFVMKEPFKKDDVQQK